MLICREGGFKFPITGTHTHNCRNGEKKYGFIERKPSGPIIRYRAHYLYVPRMRHLLNLLVYALTSKRCITTSSVFVRLTVLLGVSTHDLERRNSYIEAERESNNTKSKFKCVS